jgi:hypothetical protein
MNVIVQTATLNTSSGALIAESHEGPVVLVPARKKET